MIKQIAKLLDGREYREEISEDIEHLAKDNDIVVIFGASDDAIEIRGAIEEEIDAYKGATIYINGLYGLLNDAPFSECIRESPNCVLLKKIIEKSYAIKTDGSLPWIYETTIPHETFEIYEMFDENKKLYCTGIVFSMHNLRA